MAVVNRVVQRCPAIHWIPACAGMTACWEVELGALRPWLAACSLARATGRYVRMPEAILALSALVVGTIWAGHLQAEFKIGATAVSQSDAGAATPPHEATGDVTPVRRLREGATLVDEPGRFETAGERLSFVPSKGDAKYVVLENLNLERVARVLGENPDARQWSVSGTITEYRGGNYLIVTRAILKSRSRPGAATP